MTDARVIKATFAEWKMIKTRKVLQLVLEIPLEQQGEVLTRLGPPMPDQEKWVAVALLDELVASETERQEKTASRSAKGKEHYAGLPHMEKARTRAALLAQDPQFQMWSGCQRSETLAAAYIRRSCGVDSRHYIATDYLAYEKFLQLEAQFADATPGRVAEDRG